jgi:hypothetical protein
MEALLDAAGRGEWDDDRGFRLLGRLWTLKRAMYYVYGAWGDGPSTSTSSRPRSPTSSASRSTTTPPTRCSTSTRSCAAAGRPRSAPRSRIRTAPSSPATRLAYFVFTLRALTNYRQNIRIAAFNLGAKVIELAWLERLGRDWPDPALRALFAGQAAETRSHVLMGRLVVERCVESAVDEGLARIDHGVVRQTYLFALDEIAAGALGLAEVKGEVSVPKD